MNTAVFSAMLLGPTWRFLCYIGANSIGNCISLAKNELYTILLLHQKQKGMCIVSRPIETKTSKELLSTVFNPSEMLVDGLMCLLLWFLSKANSCRSFFTEPQYSYGYCIYSDTFAFHYSVNYCYDRCELL